MGDGGFCSELRGRRFSVLWARWIWGDLGGDFLFNSRYLPSDRVDHVGGSLRDRQRTRLPHQSRDFHLDGVELGLDGRQLWSVWSFYAGHAFSDVLEVFSNIKDGVEVFLGNELVGFGTLFNGLDALLDVVGDGC